MKGAGPLGFSHTVYWRPVRCFQQSGAPSSKRARRSPVIPPGDSALVSLSHHTYVQRDIKNGLHRRDVVSLPYISASTAETVSGGCTAAPPLCRHGNMETCVCVCGAVSSCSASYIAAIQLCECSVFSCVHNSFLKKRKDLNKLLERLYCHCRPVQGNFKATPQGRAYRTYNRI